MHPSIFLLNLLYICVCFFIVDHCMAPTSFANYTVVSQLPFAKQQIFATFRANPKQSVYKPHKQFVQNLVSVIRVVKFQMINMLWTRLLNWRFVRMIVIVLISAEVWPELQCLRKKVCCGSQRTTSSRSGVTFQHQDSSADKIGIFKSFSKKSYFRALSDAFLNSYRRIPQKRH